MRLRTGTSGFNYDEWKGSFYPPGLPSAGRLAYYAGQFDAVEINATFYRMPTPRTLAAWASAVPAGFAFGLKAPQRITHFGRLRGVDDALRFFCETARTLGERLGPLLFQLPPSFAKDLARLADFLALLPSGLDVAMEFRHDSWLGEDVYERLRARNVALCVADTGERTTPMVSTADFGYFRLRDEGYAEDDLGRWARQIRQAGAGWRAAWVFFKHEESGTGPAFARRFRELFG